MTDKLQESNSQDEFQESDLLTDFDHLPNSSHLSNSNTSFSTTNKLDNTDDIETIQLGSHGNTETAGQKYLETAPDGVACIYNIASIDPEKACEIFDLKNIQYSYKDGTTHNNVHCSFLNTKVYKETRSCCGIKFCQFISPELKNISHTVVDFDDKLFKKIFEANELSVDTHEEDTSPPHYFIGCQNYKHGEKGHRYLSLSQRTNIDYLKQLFQEYLYHKDGVNNESNAIQHYYTILFFSAKQNKCPYLHVTTNNTITHGIIQKPNLKCPVQFWYYISKGLKEYSFIIILSKGIHNHPASPLVKTPKSILNDLKDIIYNEDILDLTAHKLLNRPTLILYLKGVPLPQLHPFLNNFSKFDALIASRKHAEHPYGQNIYRGCTLINETTSDENSYIRTIRLLNDGQYFVLCGYKQQIEGLRKSKYIEIDMSFKQVHGPINEWEICAYSEAHQKTLTFAWAFTVLQTANVYQRLFEELFLCIEQDTKKPIKFNHIHNQGFGCILADEYRDQALDWVQDKKQNWVLAALSPAFTKMALYNWINTPFTANASESAHATINTTGRNLSLVAAIQKEITAKKLVPVGNFNFYESTKSI
ncbi:hypothetical protein C2G38_2174627 [Gigaspora rosea]|uniref:Uncharacterized protein n=1 Tax=Gigaspora rosea TaxID=44941 RepID=A0A397VK40_9GLOM|nr:hypothetical protein C2G38_2174627 [Gigaspora rosea]